MAEMILPGVYIDVRAEGLIAAGQVTVGNIGIVGTASRGPVEKVRLLNSYADAVSVFGAYDALDAPTQAGAPLTLVRALELAYANGATSVYAVRVQNGAAPARAAEMSLERGGTRALLLRATSPGSWGNAVEVNVWNADAAAVVASETHTIPGGGGTVTLGRIPAEDPRTRVRVVSAGLSQVKTVVFNNASPPARSVSVNTTSGALTFATGEAPAPGDEVVVTYVVPAASARRVTVRLGAATEVYTVADGAHLRELLTPTDTNPGSALVSGHADGATLTEVPDLFGSAIEFRQLGSGPGNQRGTDGADAVDTDYRRALALLENEDAHIIVAAGQTADVIGDELTAHVQNASTDLVKRDRIAVVGGALAPNATVADLATHNVASDRVIYVAPGIRTTDAAARKEVRLPGAYAAAAVAGMLSSRDPHVSLTNKVVAVAGVHPRLSSAELEQLVQNRVLALEERNGVRVVKAITTDDGAFRQITTRRIVDYAKFGVRSAAGPFIGLLNNDRVRKAMHGSINGFLASMVDEEMLTAYELAVTATREEEIRGIARVTMTIKPTFSIDYIKVTMVLG